MTTMPVSDRRTPSKTRGAPDEPRNRRPDTPAPIVVGVDATSSGRIAARAAVEWASRVAAAVVFVYVRRPPGSAIGAPYYQRRVEAETLKAQHALSAALETATEAGVPATAEVLDGPAARRLIEFSRLRKARLLVTGPRTRGLRRSVPPELLRHADRPVFVAAA